MKNKDDKEMSFLDHLEELRWNIIRAVASILVFTIVVFLSKDFVWNKIILAPTDQDFFTYRFFCNISESLCFGPDKIDFITRDVGEQFMMHMVSSFWLGVVIAFPYIIWELWKFIKPGLYEKEQKTIRGVVGICSLLFFLGVAFGYYVVTPFGLTFLSQYEISDKIQNTVTLSSYVNYLTMFVLPLGLIFELPVVVYFLAKVGIVTGQMLKSFRRHAIVVVVIIAAIITPPDVASQILVSLPLIGLYEVSILIASRVNPLPKEEDVTEDDEYDYNESKNKD